jgi:hypothetical protein
MDYILLVALISSSVLNLVLFIAYRIWRHKAKKFIRGKLYLLADGEETEMYTELHIELNDLRELDTITLEVVPSKTRKE